MDNIDRTSLIHKARSMNDAGHAIIKASRGRTRGDQKRKLIAAAPACLKGRVERSGLEELPEAHVIKNVLLSVSRYIVLK